MPLRLLASKPLIVHAESSAGHIAIASCVLCFTSTSCTAWPDFLGDIPQRKYGEDATAFGTLLQEIVTCLGEVTAILVWTEMVTLVVQQLPNAYFCLQTITVSSTISWTRPRDLLDHAYLQGWLRRGYSSDSNSDFDQSPSSTGSTDNEYTHALNLQSRNGCCSDAACFSDTTSVSLPTRLSFE